MPRRRRTKRAFQIGKRCHCQDHHTCSHDWWLRVYSAGKRQRINLTEMFPNDAVEVAAAKAKDMARKGLIIDGQLVNASKDTRLTLADVADRYVAARGERKNYYLDGLRAIEVAAANGTVVKLGDKPVDDVTTADIKHAVTVWRARKRTKAGARGGAVAERQLLQAARHLFNWAIPEGYATRTPFRTAQGVKLIKIKTTKGRTRRLEDGEAERILAVADPYIADFFTAMIETGCRPGELRTLQWSEVQADQFVVLAEKAKDRESREITITPALRKILDRRQVGPDGHDLPATAYVFGDDTGMEMHRHRLGDRWKTTCARAKVKDLHLHDLRREHATQLSEAGVAVDVIRDQLGHSNITMTNTYLGRSRNRLAQAAKQRTAHRARQAMKRVG